MVLLGDISYCLVDIGIGDVDVLFVGFVDL